MRIPSESTTHSNEGQPLWYSNHNWRRVNEERPVVDLLDDAKARDLDRGTPKIPKRRARCDPARIEAEAQDLTTGQSASHMRILGGIPLQTKLAGFKRVDARNTLCRESAIEGNGQPNVAGGQSFAPHRPRVDIKPLKKSHRLAEKNSATEPARQEALGIPDVLQEHWDAAIG